MKHKLPQSSALVTALACASLFMTAIVTAPEQAQAQQVPIPQTASEVPGPAPGTPMTRAYAQAVGRMAYVWGWPLTNVANRSASFAKAPGPGLLGGVIPVAYNRIAMLTNYIDPNQRWGVYPNQDVVYGFGYFGWTRSLLFFRCRTSESAFGSTHFGMRVPTNFRQSANNTERNPAFI